MSDRVERWPRSSQAAYGCVARCAGLGCGFLGHGIVLFGCGHGGMEAVNRRSCGLPCVMGGIFRCCFLYRRTTMRRFGLIQ